MRHSVGTMYNRSSDILHTWMEKLFPDKNQGCINFGYWKDIKRPLTVNKRVIAQKKLYCEIFNCFNKDCKTVLEVGCGRGHGVYWLRENGYEAYGLDILPSQIEKCKAAYPSLADFFITGAAENITFEDGMFDCIYSLEAAQHFVSFDSFCKESFRSLKHSGKLIVSTYFLNDETWIPSVRKIIPDNLEGFHNAISITNAVACMRAHGFEVETPPIAIGNEVFPLYAKWQKQKLGRTAASSLSEERTKWARYYTGGGNQDHPWYQAFKNGWIDYYILEGNKVVYEKNV